MTIFIRRPKDAEERQKIFTFLYDVWADELQWETPELDHDTHIMRDELDMWAKHFMAADDTGRIVGCMRNNHFSEGHPSPDMDEYLRLSSLFSLFGKNKVAISSRLAIEPTSRGKTVTSQLFSAGYCDALYSGIEIGVCYAALHLVHLYYQLGYRPYAPTFHLRTGTRVPLVLCVRDKAYLQCVDSPLFELLPRAADDRGRAARLLGSRFPRFEKPGFDRYSRKLLWAQMAHVHECTDSREHIGLFHGLNEAELGRAMVDLTRINFDGGEAVVNRNETVSFMGVLLSGRLGIGMIQCDKPQIVAMLSPGEPFGALGGFDAGKKPLDIVALEKSEVVLIRKGDLRRLLNLEGGIGERITSNLLRILFKRVHNGHQAIASLIEGRDHEIRVRHASIPPASQVAPCRSDSYDYTSLTNRDAEYQRLILQATVAENIEIAKLSQIGLKDSGTVVDVGSGPGVISTLLAKYFPHCKIIGVEPDAELRRLAAERASRRGATQCTFVDGIAEKMPFSDSSVDFCYARLLFQHLPDPKAVIREMHRVTVKDGIVAILDVDDAFVVTHPEIPGWSRIQRLVAETQTQAGGNRYIGRALFGLAREAGLLSLHVEAIPITTADIGGEAFYHLVFGFKQQVLERAGRLSDEAIQVFRKAEAMLSKDQVFAIVVTIFAHGRASR